MRARVLHKMRHAACITAAQPTDPSAARSAQHCNTLPPTVARRGSTDIALAQRPRHWRLLPSATAALLSADATRCRRHSRQLPPRPP